MTVNLCSVKECRELEESFLAHSMWMQSSEEMQEQPGR